MRTFKSKEQNKKITAKKTKRENKERKKRKKKKQTSAMTQL